MADWLVSLYPVKPQETFEYKINLLYNKHINGGLIIKQNMNVYHFPISLTEYKLASNSQEIRRRLLEDAQQFGLQKVGLNVFKKSSSFTIKCRNDRACLWRLAYRKCPKFNCFELWKFCTKHCHNGNDFDKTNYKVLRHPQIAPMVAGLIDLNIYKEHIAAYVSNKMEISRGYCMYVCYSEREAIVFNNQRQKFHFWYLHFCNEFQILCHPSFKDVISLPQMVIITHRKQMRVYKNRGQVVGIKVRGHQISEVSNSFHSYKHVTFYIYGSSNIYLPLCFAIYEANSTNLVENFRIDCNFYKILRVFFEIMGTTVRTFVIDDQEIVIQTLKYCVRSIPHEIAIIIDPYCYARTKVPKHLQEPFIRMAKSKNSEEYTRIYQAVKKSLSTEQELQIFEKYHKKIDNYSIYNSQKPKFIGRWFEQEGILKNSRGRLVKNFDKEPEISEFNQYSVEEMLYQSCFMLKKLGENRSLSKINCIELLPLEKLLEFDFLNEIRFKIEKDGFDAIVSELYRCAEADIIEIQQQQRQHRQHQYFKINQFHLNPFTATYGQLYPILPQTSVQIPLKLPQLIRVKENSEIFQCKLIEGEGATEYMCSCKLVLYRGLPCVHILKICLEYNLNVQPYIDSYWKFRWSLLEQKQLNYSIQGLSVPSKGRPKNTKRNRMRFR